MPIYEYYCKKCDKTFEHFQKISDPVKTECKVCSGKLKKLVSLSSFHLKGSGWYVTDYGGKKNGSTPVADDNGAESKKPVDKKTESKSEKKSTEAKSGTDSSSSKSA
jgi:putative FmdB family regulatory protein